MTSLKGGRQTILSPAEIGRSRQLLENRVRVHGVDGRHSARALSCVSRYSAVGIGIGDDAAADVQMASAVFHEDRADDHAQIHRPGEIEVADRAGSRCRA